MNKTSFILIGSLYSNSIKNNQVFGQSYSPRIIMFLNILNLKFKYKYKFRHEIYNFQTLGSSILK
jgi:hypothetical protein